MALVTEVNFKAAIALAAAQLTIAWSDTVKTEMAPAIKNAHAPLRQTPQLFLINRATGVVTSNDDYIAAAYAGKYPPQVDHGGFVAEEAITLTSAVIEDAAPSDIVLTFSTNIFGFKDGKLAGTVTTAKNISGIVIDGAVVTITVDTPYISTDAPVMSGWFIGNNFDSLTLSGEVITNNVA